MDINNQILSDITVFMKYAKYLPKKQTRETWKEIVDRNKNMHLKKFPELQETIEWAYQFVYDRKVLPSMRSMQFAGLASDINPARLYNCSFLIANDIKCFQETMFLLLSGCGVGYSVQKHHVRQLPEIIKPNKNNVRRYVVGDSITGWSDAIKALMKSYFGEKNVWYDFDYSDIRPKGAMLVTSGGKAPGPEPLKNCINNIRAILESKENGNKLTTLEVHDIMCHIADSVLAGGIRRAALISLFSIGDKAMLTCKQGNWWETNPQRGRANNSVVLVRSRITKDDFYDIWNRIKESGCGEPGISWTNNAEAGFNPCFSGKEKLLTAQGYKTFEELCDIGEIEIVNKNGNITKSKVWCSGEKGTVEFSDYLGNVTTCTPDHVWMLNDGSECQAKDLKGKRLMPFLNKSTVFDNEFIKLGFIQGDGGLGRLTSTTHKGIEINIGDNDSDILELFGYTKQSSDQRTWYTSEFTRALISLGFSDKDLPYRNLPVTFSMWTSEQQASFIRGLYSANGSVISGHRVSFKSTCIALILSIQKYLNSIGISSYYTTNLSKDVTFRNGTYTCKESYDLNISNFNDLVKFYEVIGFVHQYKMESLETLIISKSPFIKKVISSGKELVYDFTEPEIHWGVVNGFIAHNCHEISLKNMQFCNLTDINVSDIESQEDLNNRVKAATILGTLQASYTNFHYLRNDWKVNSEKDALLGVSLTGIASNTIFQYNIEESVKVANNTNVEMAKLIGINPSARITTVKPAGTTSLVFGTSSGIHAWHDNYYLRRIRVGKNEAIYTYLSIYHPELIEECEKYPETTAIIKIPQRAPENSSIRTEHALELLDRVEAITKCWINPGFRKGYNQHNVSCTVSIKDNEWDEVRDWMWDNRDIYSGISVLPYEDHTYTQAPFESCTKEVYEELSKSLHSIDLSKVVEVVDGTDMKNEVACGGGNCEVK